MKFFIDTADIDEIRDLAATGLLDGVTTNPSLVAKTGRNFLDLLPEICAAVEGPVSAEVTATDAEGMIAEGTKLAEIAARHDKSPAQVLIRWALQHDLVVIPKSVKENRIRENANLFDFSLPENEMTELNSLNENLRTCWDPTETV